MTLSPCCCGVFAMWFLLCCNHSSCLGEVKAADGGWVQTVVAEGEHRGSVLTESETCNTQLCKQQEEDAFSFEGL